MAQGRQQNNGSRQRCAQSAAAKAPAEPPKAVCAQLEQMNRKLAAASAEILRYQTRLFACERQMAALRQENAQLAAACEQARQEAVQQLFISLISAFFADHPAFCHAPIISSNQFISSTERCSNLVWGFQSG